MKSTDYYRLYKNEVKLRIKSANYAFRLEQQLLAMQENFKKIEALMIKAGIKIPQEPAKKAKSNGRGVSPTPTTIEAS